MAAPTPASASERSEAIFRPRRAVAVLLGFVVLLVLAAGAGALALHSAWTASPRPDTPAVEVEIPRGASLAAAARRLEAAGIVADAGRFRLAARLLGGDRPIRHGRYAMIPGQGWGRTLAQLQNGEVLRLFITIPEGMPSILVQQRLMATPRLVGSVEVPAEGSVLPQTYDFTPGETREAVLARMTAAMERARDELWPRRSARAAVASWDEAVILASIVEKESASADERPRVAGVYSNRLRIGMKLDADPTVIYPVTRGLPLGRRIRRSELKADTGYNTYVRPGLPVGPITNPGYDSLRAVLHPEPHDYLFFVADGSGGHVFARSYAEHRANVERWFALRRARGEM